MPAENEQRRTKRPPLLCPVAPKETLLRKRLPPMDTVNPLAPKVWKQRLLTPSPERPVKG
jgi:hypothetical protein